MKIYLDASKLEKEKEATILSVFIDGNQVACGYVKRAQVNIVDIGDIAAKQIEFKFQIEKKEFLTQKGIKPFSSCNYKDIKEVLTRAEMKALLDDLKKTEGLSSDDNVEYDYVSTVEKRDGIEGNGLPKEWAFAYNLVLESDTNDFDGIVLSFNDACYITSMLFPEVLNGKKRLKSYYTVGISRGKIFRQSIKVGIIRAIKTILAFGFCVLVYALAHNLGDFIGISEKSLLYIIPDLIAFGPLMISLIGFGAEAMCLFKLLFKRTWSKEKTNGNV